MRSQVKVKWIVLITLLLIIWPVVQFGQVNKEENQQAGPLIRLRSTYETITWNKMQSIFKRLGIFDKIANPSGNFHHQYESKTISGDHVVLDHTTGLIWHQSGSIKFTANPKGWLNKLNGKGYAGYSDWRLPTLEEAASLLENTKKNGKLYIDPLFSNEQMLIWTGDFHNSEDHMWLIDFNDGRVIWHSFDVGSNYFVRPVRSGK